jgi:WD40 repeat protein
VQLETDQAPHVDEPVSMTTSPDGREVILALGERLLRHEITTGRLLSELAAGHPAPRSVAWTPDGRHVLVTRFSGHALDVLDAHDGKLVRSIPIDDTVATTTVAVSADGARAAVGTEAGPIVVVPLAGDGAPTRLTQPVQPSDALGFAGNVLVAAGGEGVLRVWDAASGALRVAVPVGAPVMRLAVAADGRRVATADRSGTIRIHTMPDAGLERAIPWHRAQVRGMAWGGSLLLAGDADRQLAVWDLSR